MNYESPRSKKSDACKVRSIAKFSFDQSFEFDTFGLNSKTKGTT